MNFANFHFALSRYPLDNTRKTRVTGQKRVVWAVQLFYQSSVFERLYKHPHATAGGTVNVTYFDLDGY
jgi:hypothetical protein